MPNTAHNVKDALALLKQKEGQALFSLSKAYDHTVTGGHKAYFRSCTGGSLSVVLGRPLRAPFEPNAGVIVDKITKKKTPIPPDYSIPDQQLTLQLSLTEQDDGEVVEYLQLFEKNLRDELVKRDDLFLQPVNETLIQFMFKNGLLIPDKKVAGRYLMPLKVSQQNTQIFVVTEQNEQGDITKFRKGSFFDLYHTDEYGTTKFKQNCRIAPCFKHVMTWISDTKIGNLAGGQKLVVFPYDPHTAQKEEDDESFPLTTAQNAVEVDESGQEVHSNGNAAAPNPTEQDGGAPAQESPGKSAQEEEEARAAANSSKPAKRSRIQNTQPGKSKPGSTKRSRSKKKDKNATGAENGELSDLE
jgi:hypothetical protein